MKQHGDLTWSFKTSVQNKTLEPAWNEEHSATVSLNSKKTNEFILQLWDQDSLIDDAIGTGRFEIAPTDFSYSGVDKEFDVEVSAKGKVEGKVHIRITAREIIKESKFDQSANPLYSGGMSDRNPLFNPQQL